MARGKYQEWLTDEGLIKIEGWARDGLTDEQISENMGIAPKTLYRWKDNYSQICQALKKGKEVVDRQVENALFKRAIGYEYTERTAKVVDRDRDVVESERREFENRYKLDHPEADLQEVKDAAIKAVPTRERIVFLEVDKQVAPDTGAAAFWLKNRKPDVWRDKKETELSGNLGISNPYAGLTEDELRKLASRDG
ncbi:helix-turn-helix domain-containing protein [Enterococcus sp. SMC-9]|uniref:helix-turn-helix domain-containing protein n=1 Tax=Enterococcus sp. SMC-9 TaxID=2862343 RepID=UPI001E5CC554|nr:helix-turn-helix domain-containing protein [Enterococcus sp. SMC-9]MCD1025722.1 helix-turn-helix domain-containing protein [Enterococcus sp. SMC-9]